MADIIVNVEITETGDRTELLVEESVQQVNLSILSGDIINVEVSETPRDIIITGGGSQYNYGDFLRRYQIPSEPVLFVWDGAQFIQSVSTNISYFYFSPFTYYNEDGDRLTCSDWKLLAADIATLPADDTPYQVHFYYDTSLKAFARWLSWADAQPAGFSLPAIVTFEATRSSGDPAIVTNTFDAFNISFGSVQAVDTANCTQSTTDMPFFGFEYSYGLYGNWACLGRFSSEFTSGTATPGEGSIGIGRDVSPHGHRSVAIGRNARTGFPYYRAEGEADDNARSGLGQVALGINAKAYQTENIAIGSSASAGLDSSVEDSAHTGSIAIGRFADATMGGLALGTNSVAAASSAVALGFGAQARSNESYAFGSSAQALGRKVYAIGESAAYGFKSLSFGVHGNFNYSPRNTNLGPMYFWSAPSAGSESFVGEQYYWDFTSTLDYGAYGTELNQLLIPDGSGNVIWSNPNNYVFDPTYLSWSFGACNYLLRAINLGWKMVFGNDPDASDPQYATTHTITAMSGGSDDILIVFDTPVAANAVLRGIIPRYLMSIATREGIEDFNDPANYGFSIEVDHKLDIARFSKVIDSNGVSYSGIGVDTAGEPTWNGQPFPSGTGGGAVDSVNGQTGVVVLDAEDVGADYLHGIVSGGTLSFDDGTREFTATGISYYAQGVLYPTTTASVTIDDVVGMHYLYFNGGILTASQTVFNIGVHAVVATIHWNGTNGAVSDERHGYRRDIQWHRWAHLTVGTRYGGGLSLVAPSVASPNTIDIDAGSIWDEDIQNVIGQQTNCRLWYETAAGVWTWENSDTVYGSSVRYISTADYSINDVGVGQYINVWMYATNDIDRHIYCFLESVAAPYNSVVSARAGIPPALSGVAITQELKLLYRLIMRGNDTFIEAEDYRNASVLPAGGTSSTNASSVAVNTASFAGVLSGADTTVQAALETLDAHNHAALYAPKPAVDFYTDQDGTASAQSTIVLFSTGDTNRVLTGMSDIVANQVVTIKKVDGGTGTVTFSASSTCTIDGILDYALTSQYESITLVCGTAGADAVFYIV